jgi:tetratricopeptide (TPR) repeat protein
VKSSIAYLTVLLLFTINSFAGTENKNETVDNIRSKLQELSNQKNSRKLDSLRASLWLSLAREFELSNSDSVLKTLDVFFNHCSESNFPLLYGEGLRTKAYALAQLNRRNEAISFYNQVIQLSNRNKLPLLKAKAFNGLGIFYKNIEQYSNAIQFLLLSAELKEKLGEDKSLANTLGNLMLVFKRIEDYPKAIYYLDSANRLFERQHDTISLSKNLSHKAMILINLNKNEEALYFVNQALKVSIQHHRPHDLAIDFANKGIILNKLHRYEEALFNFNESAQYQKLTSDSFQLSELYTGLTETYLGLNKLDLALKNGLLAYNLAKNVGMKELLKKSSQLLSKIYELKGDASKALIFERIHSMWQDSINQSQHEARIARFKFDFDVKRARMQFLSDKKEQELLYENKVLKHRVILFFCLLGLISALWVLIKTRKNRRQLEYNIHRLQQAHREISRQNLEIEQKSALVEQQNFELKTKAEQIDYLNKNLSRLVIERTNRLEKANSTLKQYAFTISHQIRRPVANMLGLLLLIKSEKAGSPASDEMFIMLEESTRELDETIHLINKRLQQGDNLSDSSTPTE